MKTLTKVRQEEIDCHYATVNSSIDASFPFHFDDHRLSSPDRLYIFLSYFKDHPWSHTPIQLLAGAFDLDFFCIHLGSYFLSSPRASLPRPLYDSWFPQFCSWVTSPSSELKTLPTLPVLPNTERPCTLRDARIMFENLFYVLRAAKFGVFPCWDPMGEQDHSTRNIEEGLWL